MKLNCSVVKDIYVLYEENELSEEVKEYVEEHLSSCEECRKVYDSGVSLPDAVDEKLPEPSSKLDEKMMLKLKLSRLRIALVFIVFVIGMIAFNLYSQSRAYLVRDFQEYASDINQYYYQVDSMKRLEKSQDGLKSYNRTAGEMLNKINSDFEQVARNLNMFEKLGIKRSYSNQCFNLQLSTLVFTLNNRWQNGYFSEKDEEVYKRINDELKSIRNLSSDYGIKLNSKFFIMDTKRLKESFDKLNTLAKIYTKYNMLPEEIQYLSEDELKAKISYVFGGKVKEVSLNKAFDFKYSYKATDKNGFTYIGEIDEVTGRALEIISGGSNLKGDLIDVEKAKETIKEITLKNLGEGFDVNIKYLGINVNYESNSDMKVYTFNVQPTFKGYDIFDQYNVMVDARSNIINNYMAVEIRGNTPSAEASELKADVKYSPQEALKNIAAPDINKELFKYKGTSFIKSMFTGEYVLVHFYKEAVDTTKANSRELYINAETGKEEWPAYGDNMITY